MLTLFNIVAPSLVTLMLWSFWETRWRILSIPLGPRVVFTRSAMAMAPMKEDMRAFSPLREGERGEEGRELEHRRDLKVLTSFYSVLSLIGRMV